MLENIFINEFSKKNLRIGNIFFLSGTFLLPSAFIFGALFLLISLIISFLENKDNFIKDRWNYSIYICLLIIFFSTLKNTLLLTPNEITQYDKYLVWINLFNWIPLLLGYIGFQTYLKSVSQRVLFAKFLIIGSFPVVFSCFLQYVLGIYGPFEIFNGLIIWFQRPLNNSLGVSGLFNNANYLSIWLTIVIPFIFYFIKKRAHNFGKIYLIIICLIFSYFTILTKSRNGFLALIFTIFSFYRIKKSFYILSAFSFFGILTNYLFFLKKINFNLFNSIISERITNNFLDITPRFYVWQSAMELIKKKAIFGWGASTFPFLHQNNMLSHESYYINAQHTHNVFFELAFNFGIPLAAIILIFLLLLLTKVIQNFMKLRNKNYNLLTKAWLISCLIIFFTHLSDITLYDGKVGLIICILFAGLRCSLHEQESNMKLNINNKSLMEIK
tara:strand:+ start:294 stop:1622 length:1329 start_codon:yes stop_codon:yes gene_type:complete